MTLAADRKRLLADGSLRGCAFADAWRATVDPWLVERFTAATEGSPERGDLALVAVGGYEVK